MSADYNKQKMTMIMRWVAVSTGDRILLQAVLQYLLWCFCDGTTPTRQLPTNTPSWL